MIARRDAGHVSSLASGPEWDRAAAPEGTGSRHAPPRLEREIRNRIACTVALVLALALANALAAAGAPPEPNRTPPSARKTVAGTVTKVDEPHRIFVVRNDSGRDLTISWDGETRFAGELKEGLLVEAETVERDGGLLAVSIRARPGKSY